MIMKNICSTINRSFKLQFTTPLALFSNVRNQLKKKLDEEIKYEGQNKPSTNQYINFFNNNGWDINYKGTQVQLVRKNADYNIRLLFNARNPSTEQDQPEDQQQQQPEEGTDNFNDDYSEISVYINKNGSTKWMCAEFFVTEQNSEIAGIRFVENYQNEKADRFKERNSSTVYPGPQFTSLEQVLSDKLGEFIESVGVDHALLQNVSNFSVAYEHQFYLEWLKDIKSIL